MPREPGSYAWKPVRHHLDVRSFGVNAFSAPEIGDEVVEEHDELGPNAAQHEELYLVLSGKALFTVNGEDFEASKGTLVFLPDPTARRTARALEASTVVIAIGGKPGAVYEVSNWEKKYFEPQTS